MLFSFLSLIFTYIWSTFTLASAIIQLKHSNVPLLSLIRDSCYRTFFCFVFVILQNELIEYHVDFFFKRTTCCSACYLALQRIKGTYFCSFFFYSVHWCHSSRGQWKSRIAFSSARCHWRIMLTFGPHRLPPFTPTCHLTDTYLCMCVCATERKQQRGILVYCTVIISKKSHVIMQGWHWSSPDL